MNAAIKKTKSAGASSQKMNSLGRLFREARVDAGYDVANLATHALVDTDVVLKLETSPQHVPLQDLYAVANVLNLDPGVVLELLHTAPR